MWVVVGMGAAREEGVGVGEGEGVAEGSEGGGGDLQADGRVVGREVGGGLEVVEVPEEGDLLLGGWGRGEAVVGR